MRMRFRTALLSTAAAVAAALAPAQGSDQALAQPLPSFTSRIGNLSVSFAEFDGNTKTGDFVIPGEITGRWSEGDFRADRARGNDKVGFITLVGHVLVHKRGGVTVVRGSKPAKMMTLTSDQLRIDYKTAVYTAMGNARAEQGGSVVTAALMRLDDSARTAMLSGGAHSQDATSAMDTEQIVYHTDSGEFSAPGAVSGRRTDGDYRANSASGNAVHNDVTLVGDVVVHRLGGLAGTRASKEPITLSSDTLRIEGDAKLYTATGHVKVVQAGRTMTAPAMQLDDNTHILHLTGGVHTEQPPSRSMDAAEIVYNTQTEDFKARGGVRATFPISALQKPKPSPSPSPSRR